MTLVVLLGIPYSAAKQIYFLGADSMKDPKHLSSFYYPEHIAEKTLSFFFIFCHFISFGSGSL